MKIKDDTGISRKTTTIRKGGKRKKESRKEITKEEIGREEKSVRNKRRKNGKTKEKRLVCIFAVKQRTEDP